MQAGDGIKAENSSWKFNGEVVPQFDDHILKSVPFYNSGHELITEISDYFLQDNGISYDLGCATGKISRLLSDRHSNKSIRFVGIDSEEDMIKYAKNNSKNYLNCSFHKEDILSFEYEKSDFISSYYTVQFVKTNVRQDLINKIYESLNWGGAFIMFEKVRGSDARFQDIFTGLYNEYKLNNGYTAEEILGKTRSLKGVLEPFSSKGNLDLLSRAGFQDVIPIMKYICFEGLLAIK
tara:strand:- start:2596 stop:3303 length:708 start_codon:yes stop_codon:yes gene_type:complete